MDWLDEVLTGRLDPTWQIADPDRPLQSNILDLECYYALELNQKSKGLR